MFISPLKNYYCGKATNIQRGTYHYLIHLQAKFLANNTEFIAKVISNVVKVKFLIYVVKPCKDFVAKTNASVAGAYREIKKGGARLRGENTDKNKVFL